LINEKKEKEIKNKKGMMMVDGTQRGRGLLK